MARKVLVETGLEDANAERIDVLDLQIQWLDLGDTAPSEPPYQALIRDVADLARRAYDLGDDPGPAIALLSTVIRTADQSGAPVLVEAREMLNRLLERVGEGRISALASARPDGASLLAFLTAGDAARYSDDMGSDASPIAILAARALDDPELLKRRTEVAFALELKADHGVATPGWDEIAAPAPFPRIVDEPACWARTLADAGLNVVQAGWDETGRLIRLETRTDGDGSAISESLALVSQSEFEDWARRHPYIYGIDEKTPNLFHITTEALRWSSFPVGPTVVVADVRYQAFPANLIRVGDSFAGRAGPVATAPSLAWLTAARAAGPVGDGRRVAWISEADETGKTLSLLVSRLEPDLVANGFEVDTGPRIPPTFKGASLAVVAAHGGVHPDGRYFQSISDEGRLRTTGDDLADALRNIDVVVLFVCSAGRADRHPTANTSLGLAKRILDRGSRAVIASPWPLDSQIVGRWFEAFIAAWDAGESLIEAVFKANQIIDHHSSGNPAQGLAMSVYGDPLVRSVPPAST